MSTIEATRLEVERWGPYLGAPEPFGVTTREVGPAGSLRGRVALVSGGSQGIGRCVAVDLAQRGAAVAVNYRTSPEEADTVCQVVSSFGARSLAVAADVGDDDACAHMVEQVYQSFEQIDILVHNAAIRDDVPFHLMHRCQWDDVLRVALGGAYNLARAVINQMRQRGFGRIIFVTGSPLRRNRGGVANLQTAKAAVLGLARSLAIENARHGITVNCVSPGVIETRQWRRLSARDQQRQEHEIPMGRLGRPEEVAHLIAFLASDQAAYVTGQEIGIDGGLAI
jgi:3-oxoacyl-[acyl-carrier protein] reductase